MFCHPKDYVSLKIVLNHITNLQVSSISMVGTMMKWNKLTFSKRYGSSNSQLSCMDICMLASYTCQECTLHMACQECVSIEAVTIPIKSAIEISVIGRMLSSFSPHP